MTSATRRCQLCINILRILSISASQKYSPNIPVQLVGVAILVYFIGSVYCVTIQKIPAGQTGTVLYYRYRPSMFQCCCIVWRQSGSQQGLSTLMKIVAQHFGFYVTRMSLQPQSK